MRWLLTRGRIPFLLLIAAVTAVLGWQCLGLRIDQENRSMNADNALQTALEETFNADFNENDSLFIAVTRDELLDDTGRVLLRNLVEDFRKIDGIERVVSLEDSDFEIRKFQENLIISKDRRTTGIRLILEEFSDDGERLSATISEVRRVIDGHADAITEIVATGLPLQKFEVGKLVLRDQVIFAPLSLLILGIVLWVITRRASGMILPLWVSLITICWTLGFYAWLGHTLNMITSLLPPVIMTLSVATTIHIYLDWRESDIEDNLTRVLSAVRKLYRRCFFASLTTIIGFLSLLLCETPAVRLFGQFAALGVGIAYILGVFGIAAALIGLPIPTTAEDRHSHRGEFVHRVMEWILNLSLHHPKTVLLVTLGLAAIGVHGVQRVETDTDLLQFLGKDTQLFADTQAVESNLTGTSSLELVVTREDGQRLDDLADWKRIAAFEVAVRNFDHVTHVFSYSDPLGLIPIPDGVGVTLPDLIPQLSDLGVESANYVSPDRHRARITIRSKSVGTLKGTQLLKDVRAAADRELGPTLSLKEVGGFFRVVTESNRLVASQLKSFAIAIVMILIAIGLVYRSFWFALLAVVPNVVPLLMTGAVMGYAGIALSTGTAMIASVVIGIAVDDVIHYLSSYRKARRVTGLSPIRAIEHTTRTTGFVLTATTLALASGFWVAIFGSFQPTVYFALLSGLTMWFALACDLIVLPSMIRLFAGHKTADTG